MWFILRKLKIEMPYDTGISLLALHPQALKAGSWAPSLRSSIIHNSQKMKAISGSELANG